MLVYIFDILLEDFGENTNRKVILSLGGKTRAEKRGRI